MAGIELLRRFENYLIRGKYRPGDRIPGEQELATHFGVSRGTMREAIACCVSRMKIGGCHACGSCIFMRYAHFTGFFQLFIHFSTGIG